MRNPDCLQLKRHIWIKALFFIEKILLKHSLIGDSPFFANDLFNWVPYIEKNIPILKKEMLRVLARIDDLPNFQDISIEQSHLTREINKWKIFPFFAYGIRQPELERQCPETMRILEEIPGIKTAMYSILLPGMHIPAHRGPYRGLLRLHIPLKLPSNYQNCKIEVGKEIRYWEENKCLIFDDGFIHQVWNDTDDIRVVIFVDFLRPLSPIWQKINSLVVKSYAKAKFMRRTIKNTKEWYIKKWLPLDD